MPGPSQRGLNFKLAIWRAEQQALQLIAEIKLETKEQVKQEIIKE